MEVILKILVFETRKLCYDSSVTFTHELCKSLEKLGVEVELCQIDDIEKESSKLEQYIGKKYDAVIDMNSVLSAAIYNDENYPDLIEAPFINFIVDHPMHLHPVLNIKLKNSYVICLDTIHKEYIKKYYPHIKDVLVMPLGGSKASAINEFEERHYHILFPATYTPLSYFTERLDSMGDSYLSIAYEILDMIKDGASINIHELFKEAAGADDEFFPIKMYKARYIDRYIREVHRQMILDRLLSIDFTIDAVGFRWEQSKFIHKKNFNIHPACSYPETLNMIADSQIVLNVQPLFPYAPHDRVFNSMINGAVSLTDSSSYLDKKYNPGEDYLLYNIYSESDDFEKLRNTLSDFDSLKRISYNGCNKATLNDSWDLRVLMVNNFIKDINDLS